MEHNRKQKLLMIIALMLSIASLSIGFAAFSVSLNISSQASVTPNTSDFHVSIYGIDANELCMETGNLNDCEFSSSTETNNITTTIGGYATIDNNTISLHSSLENIYLNMFDNPVYYYFKVVNDGKYNAYMNKEDALNLVYGNFDRECTAIDDTSQELVDKSCECLQFSIAAYQKKNDEYVILDQKWMLVPGEEVVYEITQYHNSWLIYADGPFNINIEGIKINFSTVEE